MNVYLKFFQLVLNVNFQRRIHGLIMVDEVLESAEETKKKQKLKSLGMSDINLITNNFIYC